MDRKAVDYLTLELREALGPSGGLATRVFSLVNRKDLDYAVDDAKALLQAVATGALGVPDIAASIERHLG